MSSENLRKNMKILTNPIGQMASQSVTITKIEAWACRQPIDNPVWTSFGIMTDRPAVFVRLEDAEGCFGWGEIFANWPAAGAEHRVNLLEKDIAELVLGKQFQLPDELFHYLDKATAIRALQCGEWGPFRQVTAGLDIALWDLFARRAGKPMSVYINNEASNRILTYASGIHIASAGPMIENSRKAGFETFKVKVGFDMGDDIDQLSDVMATLLPNERLCADANQVWDLDAAIVFTERAAEFNLLWLEEPLRADIADTNWSALAAKSSTPLAGGENIAGFSAFDSAIALDALSVIQPDVAKWGGTTGCLAVAKSVIAAGKTYCPHFLGGGVGLAASAHLLAAVGGKGRLEVDVNENILRDAFRPVGEAVSDGHWQLSSKPGLGIETLPEGVKKVTTHYCQVSSSR